MAATQVRGLDIYDGSVCRVDLNVADAGKAVIRKILEVANSGIKVTNSATGADPGTGDVNLALDFTYLATLYQGKLSGTGLVRMEGAVVNYDNTTYYSSANLPAYPTTLPASDVYTWAKQATKPVYTKLEVGLGNVDNTADASKSVATSANTTQTNFSSLSVLGNIVWHSGNFTPSNYLLLAGGNLTGALGGVSATFSGSVTAKESILNTSDWVGLTLNTGGAIGSVRFSDTASYASYGGRLLLIGTETDNGLAFRTNSTIRLTIGNTGAATFSGSVNAKGLYFADRTSNTAVNGYQFGTNGAQNWIICSSPLGTATNDLSFYSQGFGTVLNLNYTSGAATFPGTITATSSIYVGGYAEGSGAISIQHTNLTQGLSIGYRGITTNGTATNQDITITPKGTGVLSVVGNATFSGSVTAGGYALTPMSGLTTNYLPKWNGSSLVNSAISDDGTYIYLPVITGAASGILVNSGAGYTGKLSIQSGYGSSGAGGSLVMFGHSHATKAGWVVAGISANSGGKFSVQNSGIGSGTDVFTVDVSGNAVLAGSITAPGGGFNSLRELKNIHKDWGGNALNVISKFKIRDFNYKTRPDYDRTLGFIIDEIPKEIGDYAISGEERNAVNTYTLHGLSFKGLQEVKTKLDVQESELDWQSAKIILLEKKIMELEGRLN